MTDVMVREISSQDFADWNAYVYGHENGTFCHLAEWKAVIEEGAGQVCPYVAAFEGSQIVGVLPLTHRKSLLFGDALISNMFCVYGGVLANSPSVALQLEEAAWAIAVSHNLKTVEYRTVSSHHKGDTGWHVAEGKSATFIKPLKQTADDILLDIPRKQRAVVRKSLKNSLSIRIDDEVDTFYKLYAESVRNLGTPVFPKKLFERMVQYFGELVDIQLVRNAEGIAIASLMSFFYKNTVLPYYAGGSPTCRELGAHDYMYYQLMVRAAEKGIKYYDFGRSKIGSGPYNFKKNWGFEPTPLEYQYRLAEGKPVPSLDSTSGKYRLMVEVWKKLPLFLSNKLGPALARHLG